MYEKTPIEDIAKIPDYPVSEEIKEFLTNAPFKFAKSRAATNPHYYIIESKINYKMMFKMNELLNEHGYLEVYWGEKYRCLNINRYKYWITFDGFDGKINKILNRIPLTPESH